MKEKVQWRVEQGLPLGGPPIGYVMKNKMFEINEEYAKHIREMDAIYLEHESTDDVVREFRRRGYRTPGSAVYTVPFVCRMLRNATYAGKIEYEGETYDARWKPIRTWETHQLIQKTMDRNIRHGGSRKGKPKEYAYLLQGLIRCGNCRHMMSPQPGTSCNGRLHPYYSCGTAQKTRGTSCPIRYVPAETVDRAILGFLKKLHVKPEMVKEFARRANEFTSVTVAKLKEDLDRVRQQLGAVRTKITNIVDAIAEGGKSVMATMKDRFEALEAEKVELDASETKLRAEYDAEQTQEIGVQDQIRTLALFDQLVSQNQDQPERLKSLIPRFINYVLWHAKDGTEGIIEVGLFPRPVAFAPGITYDSATEEVRSQPSFVRGRVTDGIPSARLDETIRSSVPSPRPPTTTPVRRTSAGSSPWARSRAA